MLVALVLPESQHAAAASIRAVHRSEPWRGEAATGGGALAMRLAPNRALVMRPEAKLLGSRVVCFLFLFFKHNIVVFGKKNKQTHTHAHKKTQQQ